MIIDTDKVNGWIKKHSVICIPVATGFLSWYAATRWQAALDNHNFALGVFYFSVSAVSGVTTAALTIFHFARLGIFE